MSETMIERVAKAICKSQGGDWNVSKDWSRGKVFRHMACAAIEAMREPTEDMKADPCVHWDYSCHVCGGLKEGWQAMISAALSDFL